MNLRRDFKEFIELAISTKLKFLVIDGWAFDRYAEPHMTGDIDFFVSDSPESEAILRNVLNDSGFGDVLPMLDDRVRFDGCCGAAFFPGREQEHE